jgi:predicted nucleic acid-binding Zn ribbon protein
MGHIKRFGFAVKGIGFYRCSVRREIRKDDNNGKKE